MSASYIVDLSTTTVSQVSIPPTAVGFNPSSGVIVGSGVDMKDARTYCNLFVAAGAGTGGFRVAVQTSDSLTSGSFTDPTSGLAALPTNFLSGGIAVFNSGNLHSGLPFMDFSAFQRPHRYARAVILSGDTFAAPVAVGFVEQASVTTSGVGYSYAPQTASPINV